MLMDRSYPRGFTLVEVAVTILLLGLVLAFSIPTFRSLSNSYQLKGATENVAGQLRLGRERAIATGQIQHYHLPSPSYGNIYYLINHAVEAVPKSWNRWNLPKGITYYSGTTLPWVEMKPDGRANTSGFVILKDERGRRDTVSVLLSGLVLTK